MGRIIKMHVAVAIVTMVTVHDDGTLMHVR